MRAWRLNGLASWLASGAGVSTGNRQAKCEVQLAHRHHVYSTSGESIDQNKHRQRKRMAISSRNGLSLIR